MNPFGYYWSRMLAFAFIGVLMLGIQSVGAGIRQWRERPGYRRLGAAVSDAGHYHLTWWLWPPQAGLSGRYHGIPFRYAKVGRESSHLMIGCVPSVSFEISKHKKGGHLPAGLSGETLERAIPGWTSVYSSRGDVSWSKRSLDRRPPGFGSAPGIDLYRQSGTGFNLELLKSDLAGLQTFCTENG